MPYYTGAGDKGDTGLCGGAKVSKGSEIIAAIGEVDELNSAIGLCRCVCRDADICGNLERIQNELFVLGSDLSGAKGISITDKQLKETEKEIDGITEEIGELKGFILPMGSELAARLHFARAVCRRAERAICRLADEKKVNEAIPPYINRLSTLLFVLARLANERAKIRDVEWEK
ncbi:MAG: cob(I)yrinic acid a,c-diamide adenosyltransferase [Candidatus Aenigmatarchaeota archaeon]